MRRSWCVALAVALLWLTACGGEPEPAQNDAAAIATAAPPYRVYVTNEGSGDLTVIAGGTHEVLATVPLGKRPRGIEVNSDGRQLFVALSGSPPAPAIWPKARSSAPETAVSPVCALASAG